MTEEHDNNSDREQSVKEIIEALRQWDGMFYSEPETKWLMDKAADYLEQMRIVT